MDVRGIIHQLRRLGIVRRIGHIAAVADEGAHWRHYATTTHGLCIYLSPADARTDRP